MSDTNQVSISMSSGDMDEIFGAIATIQSRLSPVLISLTREERKGLLKMGDKSVAFVEKAMEHAIANPTLVPPYTDIGELKKDVIAVRDLLKIQNQLKQLNEGLDDTIMLAGSEAFTSALSFYNSVKGAVKKGVPMAKSIEEDLADRFVGKPRKPKGTPPSDN
ncbi:hypothetical protein WSM22_34610 [Cytophagales bacterium WSM2-2]|nr:hypothetical protein WSM22_34610 [Cytophagales bacterium WSM2-2]